jgi:hypothetical protein
LENLVNWECLIGSFEKVVVEEFVLMFGDELQHNSQLMHPILGIAEDYFGLGW